MQVKPGVVLNVVHPWMEYAAAVFDQVHQLFGYGEGTLTGGNETAHGRVRNTLHPDGAALDFRRWAVRDLQLFGAVLRQVLGPAFDVVLESDHYHIELSPLALSYLRQYSVFT